MSPSVHVKEETRKCDVCCISCIVSMHLNQVDMASRKKEFSDESCHNGVSSQHSVNDGSASFSQKAEKLQLAAGQPSNLGRFYLSYGYLSPTKELKPEFGSSELSAAMEDTMTLRRLVSRAKLSEGPLPARSFCNSDHLSSSNEDSKPIEGQDDNMSSVICLDGVNTLVSCEHGSLEIKGVPYGSDSVESSLLEGINKEVRGAGDDAVHIVTAEVLKSSNVDKQLVETLEVREPAMQASTEEDSEESDVLEHDVKVCDICGDAGREDLLAVCSRCSDGAEHTYCMREMLQKVPEGDWLCEECKFADETENGQGIGPEGKSSSVMSTSSTLVPDTSFAENVEVPSMVKSAGFSELRSPNRLSALSRESSLKNNDNVKGKIGNMVPHSACPVQESLENVRSSFSSKQQSPKGALLKSNSFSALSSKSKVKLDEFAIQKQRGKERPSTLKKDGPVKSIGKSMSFKANTGRSIAVDAKGRMLSGKISCSQDMKGPKVVREGTMFGMNLRKLDQMGSLRNNSTNSTTKLDRKLVSGGEASPVTSASNHREPKVVQFDGRLTGLAKSGGWSNVKGADPLSAGASSIDGMSITSNEQKSSHSGRREDPLSCSSRDANGIRNGGLARPRDLTNFLEKAREGPLGRLRHSLSSVSKSNFCQKCKEVGHECESCPISSSSGQGTEAPPTRSSREDIYSNDKFKAAITSDMLKKPGIYRRNKETGKSGEFSMVSSDLTCVNAPSLPNISREADGVHEGQATSSSPSDPPSQMNVNSSLSLKMPSKEAGSSKDLPCMLASMTLETCQVSVIPEHDYTWKGNFEVYRGNMLPEVLGGVQAHLSTRASPRVLDTVKLFPGKICLNEVSRRSAWPTQFHETGAKDENIALYFFAEDLESYERSYKRLVEKMIKSDLALKGNFDGIELLIFASNQLPEKSQRWNMLFYLWGVFRSRTINGFNHESASSQISGISTSNLVSLDEDSVPAVQPMSNELSLPKCNGGNLSSSGKSCNINPPSSGSALTSLAINPSSVPTTGYNSINSHNTDQKCLDSQRILGEGQQNFNSGPSCGFLARAVLSDPQNKGSEIYLSEARSPDTMQLTELDIDKKSLEPMERSTSLGSASPHSIIGDKENGGAPELLVRTNEVEFEDCFTEISRLEQGETTSKEDLTAIRAINCQQLCRKRPSVDLDTASETSVVTANDLSILSADLKGPKKKLKSGNMVMSECYTPGNADLVHDGYLSENYRILKEKGDKSCDRLFVLEDRESTERHFFPIVSDVSETLISRDSIMPLRTPCSGGLVRSHDGVPNLDLALGAKTDAAKQELLPLLVGVVDNTNKHGEHLGSAIVKKEADSVSGPLSLSLSFPFPDGEQKIKPVSDAEQLIPERRHVSTSLLLFGGLLDK